MPDQLKAAGYTWKGYEGDMGNDPTREGATYGHPTLNSTDITQAPKHRAPPCRSATSKRRVTTRSCISIRSSTRRIAGRTS
ncbi:MAG: hypothetical protein CPDRYMAC_2170 [uncultured Paraburkholderia sp.]|nr:MAG: hypothetical protein CPDRYDRY_2080 [uncultured Paraburkholderia sp.]CAH2922924.1 MAG: hypothetical protein CPDRYMAC_2170 [uncultured Paraburkholderia sp.]